MPSLMCRTGELGELLMLSPLLLLLRWWSQQLWPVVLAREERGDSGEE